MRGNNFSARMHQAAVSHRSEPCRKRDFSSKYLGSQIALRKRHRLSRTECDRLKRPAILPQRDLAFGSAVEVIEHNPRQPAFSDAAQVRNIDDAGWIQFSRHAVPSFCSLKRK